MPDYLVKRSGTKKFTVTQEKTVVAENLSELADVSVSNLPGSDKFVLAYNAATSKFELIAADALYANTNLSDPGKLETETSASSDRFSATTVFS